MSSKRLLLKNFSLMSLAQAISVIAGLATTMWLTRALGPEMYGVLGYGMAVLAFFSIAATFGTDTLGVREVAKASRPWVPAGTLFGFRLLLGALVFVLFLVSVPWLAPDPANRSVLYVQGAGLLVTALIVDYLFQGREHMAPPAYRLALQPLIILAGVLLFVSTPADVATAAWVYVLGTGIPVVLLGIVAWRAYPRFKPLFRPRRLKRVLVMGTPFALYGIVHTTYYSFDLIMLGWMRSAEEVGYYRAAYQVVTLSLVASGLFFTAYLPRFVQQRTSPQARGGGLSLYAAVIMFMAAPIAIFGALYSSEITLFLYGDAFGPTAFVMSLLMINVFVFHLRMCLDAPMAAWDMAGVLAKVGLLAAATNVVGNLILIPDYGMTGAAIASLIGQGVAIVAFTMVHYRHDSRPPYRPVFKGMIAAAVTLGLSWALVSTIRELPLIPALLTGGISVLALFALAAFSVKLIAPKTLIEAFKGR